MAGWTGSDDEESLASLDRAIALGCNFFDTAWAYGDGHSERLLGRDAEAPPGRAALRRHEDPAEEPEVAGASPDTRSTTCSRPTTSANTPRTQPEEPRRVRRIDLQQFHVWSDDVGGRRSLAARGLGAEGRGPGARDRHQHQPLAAGERPAGARHRADRRGAGRLQRASIRARRTSSSPPASEHDIAVIARVPFDEGSLTGTLTRDSTWPQGDFRNLYFNRG